MARYSSLRWCDYCKRWVCCDESTMIRCPYCGDDLAIEKTPKDVSDDTPDRKKVIHALETCIRDDVGIAEMFPCNECGYFVKVTDDKDYDCMNLMIKDAITLLREQEPIEPIETLDGNGNLWRDCGKCGGVLPKDAQYCPTCGRRIKQHG